ncbi:sensor domain-containing diguanylate cyclase/phosphohydrolase [Neorhodopirellula lusitana]|uniref:sensor domain-containing diguanylate cyclase/phosphohydrolase n=1 Tax=Neorhodopirellula lusitana TaxID=445327 RepID=UPI0038512FC5
MNDPVASSLPSIHSSEVAVPLPPVSNVPTTRQEMPPQGDLPAPGEQPPYSDQSGSTDQRENPSQHDNAIDQEGSDATDGTSSASRLSDLLVGLGEVATGELTALTGRGTGADASQGTASPATEHAQQFENRLAMVRLGMATSLFYALRTKHAPTAAHSLRVAISCSAWSERLGLGAQQRDQVEVAALLHDIGKIGIPDRILRKPGKLTVEEQMTMDVCPELGCEILRGCTDNADLLDIVRYGGTWYDSRRQADSMRGDALPLGARMLAIAGAFDAMTTDQVYRAALSRERALQELFRGNGTQFDPELTHDFVTMLEKRPEMLHECVVDRWLQQLQVGSNSTQLMFGRPISDASGTQGVRRSMMDADVSFDELAKSAVTSFAAASQDKGRPSSAQPFYRTLCEQLRDGVAFTDREGQILYWNDSMAYMTKVAASATVGQYWDASTLNFVSNDGSDMTQCPIRECVDRQIVVNHTMRLVANGSNEAAKDIRSLKPSAPVADPNGRDVLMQVAPVKEEHGGGAVVIVRDISDRAEMQHQIQTLHKKATSDPLTGAANRAEFDTRLMQCTTKAKQQGATFSLIMCDIDHFKKVNDVHGHQAGDEALIQFAKVLESHTRGSDLVARYGGEEFAFLAINSDNATATRRAEEIRKAVSATPLDGLEGESVTVSMGVTEFQTGDAPETVIARADRALMTAKENGRNRVVQLGSGLVEAEEKSESGGWFGWLGASTDSKQQEFQLATPVPTDLAVEKLRGFISDHRAEIINVSGSELSLRLNVSGGSGRRAADHQMSLNALIRISEMKGKRGSRGASLTQTKLTVSVTPVRSRDRRSAGFSPCVSQVISSLRSYLMAELITDQDSEVSYQH